MKHRIYTSSSQYIDVDSQVIVPLKGDKYCIADEVIEILNNHCMHPYRNLGNIYCDLGKVVTGVDDNHSLVMAIV